MFESRLCTLNNIKRISPLNYEFILIEVLWGLIIYKFKSL